MVINTFIFKFLMTLTDDILNGKTRIPRTKHHRLCAAVQTTISQIIIGSRLCNFDEDSY